MGDAAQLFAGTSRFEVRRRLGEGGFGVVYEAYDRVRRSVVALKTLRQTDPAALRRFKAEFRSLADVVHPRLATLYELFCEDDRWFFTMELVEGADFLAYLRAVPVGERVVYASTEQLREEVLDAARAPTLRPPSMEPALTSSFEPDVERLRPVLLQLAEGIDALHGAGMLHRDVKPSNVLVDAGGRVVVLDFGLVTTLALAADERTRQHIVGTPEYMAPEQAFFGEVSPASDWYAVGVMLYQALTGRLPVEGGGLSVLLEKQRVDPVLPSRLARGVPADLEGLAMALLARKPSERPEGAEILARLSGGPRGWTTPRRGVPFVGREPELGALDRALADVTRGKAAEVHVAGRSGIGKTALVRTFLERAAASVPDVCVLQARCYEQESVPYKAWDGLVDALGQRLEQMSESDRAAIIPPGVGALARVFSSLRGVEGIWTDTQSLAPDPRELRRRAALALRDLLANLARTTVLVLFVDDMQWGDIDSARLLAEVTHEPDPPPLLLVLAYRDEEAARTPLLAHLRDRPGVRALAVSELSASEGRALVAAIAPERAHDSRLVDSVVREAGGSPFFVDEIARNLDAREDDPVQPIDVRMLDAVLRRRIERLAPAARACLEAVAVSGRPIARELVSQVAATGSAEPAAMAALRAGRLLRSAAGGTGEELETFHDRVREVVVAGIDAPSLRRTHGALAAALEAREGTDPERLGTHWEAAGDLEKACVYVERAAEVAVDALAFERAARLYRKALDLRGAGDADEARLRAALGEALVNAGRGAEGARELVRAAQRAGPIEALDLRRRGAEHFMLSGHIDEGKATHKTVLDALQMRAPESRLWALVTFLVLRTWIAVRGLGFREQAEADIDRERLLRMDTLWSLTIGMAIVDQMRALALQSRHLLLALRAGEPSRMAYALAGEIAYCAHRGVYSRARVEKLLPVARALAQRVRTPQPLAMVSLSEGIALYGQARYAEARATLERAARLLRETCAGVTWHLNTAHAYTLFSQRALGEVKAVVTRYAALSREAEDRGDLYGVTLLASRIGHLGALGADDVPAALDAVDQSTRRWSAAQFTMQHCYALVSRVDCDLYAGDAEAGIARLDAAWPALERSMSLRNVGMMILSVDARARLLLAGGGNDARARERLRRDVARLRVNPSPLAGALAALLDAGIALSGGDADGARRLFVDAEAACERMDLALHAACARRRRGQIEGGDEGARLVAEADEQLRAQGIARPERWARTIVPA
jgi:tetratricopeptide (TPR) repeat protein